VRLPYNISNQSLTFFVQGKPYSLTKTAPGFEEAKRLLLQSGSHPVDQLTALVDVRQALVRDSHGTIQWIEGAIVWQGQPLAGVWVDKILDMHRDGLPYTPVWNALGSLVRNPTPAAIERLPVFLERSNLGFLEDGRFIAYKAVRGDYMDIHTGSSFRNMVGDTPHMPRDQVNANPDACCSTGLHVGTPDYVKDFGLGARGRRVMLIAVWPHDVVSVPFSYEGTKMRICAYEVIDELDEAYASAILGRPVLTRDDAGSYRPQSEGYKVPEVPLVDEQVEEEEEEISEYQALRVGDVIQWDSHGAMIFSRVIRRDPHNVWVRDTDGDEELVPEHDFTETIQRDDVTAAMLVVENAEVEIQGHKFLKDGTYRIACFSEDGNDQSDLADPSWEVQVGETDNHTTLPVENGNIKLVIFKGETLFPLPPIIEAADIATGDIKAPPGSVVITSDQMVTRHLYPSDTPGKLLSAALAAKVGDRVETVEGGWPPAGIYPVIRIDEGAEYRLTLQTENDGNQGVLNKYVKRIVT
jgi:hypothetical protein